MGRPLQLIILSAPPYFNLKWHLLRLQELRAREKCLKVTLNAYLISPGSSKSAYSWCSSSERSSSPVRYLGSSFREIGRSPKPTPIGHVGIHHLPVYSHRTGSRSSASLPQTKRQTHQASILVFHMTAVPRCAIATHTTPSTPIQHHEGMRFPPVKTICCVMTNTYAVHGRKQQKYTFQVITVAAPLIIPMTMYKP